MNTIRYTQRICSDKGEIEHFLQKKRVGVIGLVDTEGFPYTLPLNYVWCDGNIYFHGMGSGKKVEILQKEPTVSFSIFEEFGTVKDAVPCKADTSYMSVLVFGKARKVVDTEESTAVLRAILDKFMPDFYKTPLAQTTVEKYRSSHDNNGVAVYKITPIDITVKNNIVNKEELFSK